MRPLGLRSIVLRCLRKEGAPCPHANDRAWLVLRRVLPGVQSEDGAEGELKCLGSARSITRRSEGFVWDA
jgi:hypothetical protein